MARRILIVDDEPAIRFAVTEYFIAYGYRVDATEDATSALQLMKRHVYDAVIADLRLGGSREFGGLDVIDAAYKLPKRPCVVMLSADNSPSLVAEAKRRGANFTLHKPLPLYELKGRIAEFLVWRESGRLEEDYEPGQFSPTLPGG